MGGTCALKVRRAAPPDIQKYPSTVLLEASPSSLSFGMVCVFGGGLVCY